MKNLYTIIILSILIMSGCTNNGSENNLKEENEQLKQENAKLSVAKEGLELDLKIVSSESSRENEQLTSEISSLQVENEGQKKTINRYQKAFDFLTTNTNTIADTLSIFSAEEVKKGSHIAGLIVSDAGKETANESTSYYVKFSGEFEVRGSIIHNVIGGSQYSFLVKENFERIPHTLGQFERGSVYFDIENDEKLKKILGDKLEELSEEGELETEGVFKNYSFNYVPETDFPSFAEFVGLKSKN